MSTVINTNLASLYAQNNLSNAQNNLATSVMRLSSGLRINSAKDDAAGLAISQNMQSQINGINQSVRNLNDATNLLQVADTSLATVQDMLLRMKQLATQGFNGSLSGNQKSDLVDELKQLNSEINQTSERTKFNGNSLIAAQVGLNETSSTMKLNTNASPSTYGTATSVTKIEATGAKAQTYTFSQVGASATVQLTGADGSAARAAITLTAAGTQTLDFSSLGIKVTLSTSGAETDTTLAGTVSGLSTSGKNTIVVSGDNPNLDFQSGPDSTLFIRVATINVTTDDSASNYGKATEMTNVGRKIIEGTSSTALGASNGLTYLQTISATATADQWAQSFLDLASYVDTAIDYVSTQRSVFGAQVNRLSYVSTNMQAQSTNLQSSKSAIIDTDFAAETAKLTKGQIMQQAATAMLAQANQMPNVVLSLLK
jgi:flagellin